MTGDTSDAEDLVQETLLRVARRWKRVRFMDHPAAYARRILVNLVLHDAGRRSRQRAELWPADDAAEAADESAARALREVDDLAEFRWALAQLPVRQRAVLVLRYWADLPVAEVADMLGCSEGTVRSTASRAAARLAGILAHSAPPVRRTMAADAGANEVRVAIDRYATQEREPGTAGHLAGQPPEHSTCRRQRERLRRQVRQRHFRSPAGRRPHLIPLGLAEPELRHVPIVRPASARVHATSPRAYPRQLSIHPRQVSRSPADSSTQSQQACLAHSGPAAQHDSGVTTIKPRHIGNEAAAAAR
jgi:RNA polymerase sigma factor (sigma-70 family)